jgi:hypothetical protein
MEGRALPHVMRRGRLWRGLWPDHNPLRRTCDRVEAAIVAGLLVAFLIGAPLLALAAGRWAYGTSLRAERAERPVPAVLLSDAPAQAVCWCAVVEPRAWAMWTAPDGVERRGWVPVPAGDRAGSTVTVWVGASGEPVASPLTNSELLSRAVLAAVAGPVTMGFFLLCGGMLARRALDRRRLAAWDAEWRTIGPRWTTPR